jgi:hypothetical protein
MGSIFSMAVTQQHWVEFADWHPADIYAAFYPELDQDVGLRPALLKKAARFNKCGKEMALR